MLFFHEDYNLFHFCVWLCQVSYNVGLRHFTVHSYPFKTGSYGFSCFKKTRTRKDFRFVASSSEEALQWITGFGEQQCFVNCLPHPLSSSKKQSSDGSDHLPETHIKCKNPPKVLVILNPRSGRGRSSKVFHDVVEPIFKVCSISGPKHRFWFRFLKKFVLVHQVICMSLNME